MDMPIDDLLPLLWSAVFCVPPLWWRLETEKLRTTENLAGLPRSHLFVGEVVHIGNQALDAEFDVIALGVLDNLGDVPRIVDRSYAAASADAGGRRYAIDWDRVLLMVACTPRTKTDAADVIDC